MRFLLYLLVCAPILRNVVMFWAGAVWPGYSLKRDFLSELLAYGAPHRLAATLLGVGLAGIAFCLGGLALFRVWSPSRIARVGAVLLILSGVGFIGIGLTPCDPGCLSENPGPRMAIHLLSAAVALGLLLLTGLTFGASWLLEGKRRGLGLVLIGLSGLGLLAYIALFSRTATLDSPGLVQRVAQWTGDLCVVLIAGVSLSRLRHSPSGSRDFGRGPA